MVGRVSDEFGGVLHVLCAWRTHMRAAQPRVRLSARCGTLGRECREAGGCGCCVGVVSVG